VTWRQSIYSFHGITKWQEVFEVFEGDEIQYEEMNQSYRLTLLASQFPCSQFFLLDLGNL